MEYGVVTLGNGGGELNSESFPGVVWLKDISRIRMHSGY